MTEATWYKKVGLSQVNGFLDPKDRNKLKGIAKQYGRSLVKHVSKVLENHISDEEKKEIPECENCKKLKSKNKM